MMQNLTDNGIIQHYFSFIGYRYLSTHRFLASVSIILFIDTGTATGTDTGKQIKFSLTFVISVMWIRIRVDFGRPGSGSSLTLGS
jgi:hypothetical protein